MLRIRFQTVLHDVVDLEKLLEEAIAIGNMALADRIGRTLFHFYWQCMDPLRAANVASQRLSAMSGNAVFVPGTAMTNAMAAFRGAAR